MFDNPHWVQYNNPKYPDVVHTSMCSNRQDLARIVNLHKGWTFKVWELIELNDEELQEVLDNV